MNLRAIIFPAMVLLVHLQASGQDEAKSSQNRKINIGLFAGINGGKPDTDPDDYLTEGNTGWQAGLFARSRQLLYYQGGLTLFSSSTDFTSGHSSTDNISDKVKITRLQLPLYIGINLLPLDHKVFNVRAYAGPTLSYALFMKGNGFGLTTDDLNRTQFDLGVGLGFDISLFKIDAGFNYGLVNSLNGLKSHNFYDYLSLGIGF
jgi:hypothetical protein